MDPSDKDMIRQMVREYANALREVEEEKRAEFAVDAALLGAPAPGQRVLNRPPWYLRLFWGPWPGILNTGLNLTSVVLLALILWRLWR
jgi:hypothetical protein